MHVGRAGNARDRSARCCAICSWPALRPDHLHVDGRGQAEVQNLVGDIGGFEEEGVREFLVQALAQPVLVYSRWGRGRPWLERDQNIAVAGAQMVGCRRSQVETAVGMPMLSMMVSISRGRNDLADFALDGGKETSVSSMRVPVGPWHAGASGRNPRWGRNRGRPNRQAERGGHEDPKPASTGARWSRPSAAARCRTSAHQLKAPVEEVVNAPDEALPPAGSPCAPCA
jgi:hypothetical protein